MTMIVTNFHILNIKSIVWMEVYYLNSANLKPIHSS